MTQALKTGDRVRVTFEGEITHTSHGRNRIQIGDFDGEWAWFKPERAEKIEPPEPEPKFKVGDRVRFKTNRYETEHRRSGTGTIYRIGNNAYHGVAIDGHGPDFGYWESELEHAPSQEFKPRPGDKIRNTKTGREGRVFAAWPEFAHTNPELAKDYIRGHDDWCNPVPVAAIEEYEEHHPGTYEIIERGDGGPF